jgi:nucleotide-binding universal stress UspA family protein
MNMPTGAQPGPLREGTLSVLLATDGSEHSVKAARVLVEVLGGRPAEVRLVTVLSMEMKPTTYMGDLSDADQRRARIAEETETAVGEVRGILEEAGLPVSVHHRLGNPSDEVLAEVDELFPDLVVVGRRGLGRAASLVLGSVSSSLLRHSAVPVLTVP